MLHLTDSDKKVRCLCGLPIFINQIPIYPITVRQVIEAGEIKYNTSLMSIIALHKTLELISEDQVDLDKLSELTPFELLLILSTIHPDFCVQISDSISFFLNDDYDVKFNTTDECFDITHEDQIIGQLNKDNYEEFISVIKLQNYQQKEDEQAEQLAKMSDKQKELWKKRERDRAMVRKLKGEKDGSNLTYEDYISILLSKSSEMNVEKCLNATLYFMFNYLERLALIDQYEVGIQQLMAGAKPEQVKLTHWLSSLMDIRDKGDNS